MSKLKQDTWLSLSAMMNPSGDVSPVRLPLSRDEAKGKVIESLQARIAEFQDAIAYVEELHQKEVYEPELDEPIVWSPTVAGSVNKHPNPAWLAWYLSNHETTPVTAYKKGVELIERLSNEFPRDHKQLSSEQPPLAVFNQALTGEGIYQPELSLRWVLWSYYKSNEPTNDLISVGLQELEVRRVAGDYNNLG